MTTSSNAASAAPRRPWWNFTLRELLLLMVAVGACIALFQKEYYPRQLSPFATDLRMNDVIENVLRESGGGKPGIIVTSGIHGRVGNGVCFKEGPCYLDSRLILSATFMRDLQDAVREALTRAGCRTRGSARTGYRNDPESFTYWYHYLNNVGIVTVRFHPAEGTSAARVYVTCYEISRPTN
jgi:hypothetical protein